MMQLIIDAKDDEAVAVPEMMMRRISVEDDVEDDGKSAADDGEQQL